MSSAAKRRCAPSGVATFADREAAVVAFRQMLEPAPPSSSSNSGSKPARPRRSRKAEIAGRSMVRIDAVLPAAGRPRTCRRRSGPRRCCASSAPPPITCRWRDRQQRRRATDRRSPARNAGGKRTASPARGVGSPGCAPATGLVAEAKSARHRSAEIRAHSR